MSDRTRLSSKTIETLSQYIEIIENDCDTDRCLFRGQREEWELLPKIARIKSRSGPNDEQLMIDDFRRYVGEFVPRVPENDWDLLSIAQHHGMATRLLDWTTNALAALWFAVEKPPTSQKPGVVYFFDLTEGDIVINRNSVDPFCTGRTLFFAPNAVATRIRTQGGFFSVHRPTKEKKWVPLEKNNKFRERINSILIQAKDFSQVRLSLTQCGVNRSSLFPDLDGLCSHLTWDNSLLEDESPNSGSKPAKLESRLGVVNNTKLPKAIRRSRAKKRA